MKKIGRCSGMMLLAACLAAASGCGPQLSKEQQQSRQMGIPSNNGQAADRKKSEEMNGNPSGSRSGYHSDAESLRIQSAPREISLPLVTANHTDYVVASDFAAALNYNYRWDAAGNVFQIGEHDAAYEFRIGSTTAVKDGDPVSLSAPPVLRHSQVHIPAAAIVSLFADELSAELRGKSIVLHGADLAVSGAVDGPEERNTGAETDFEDDPNDPFKGDEGNDRLEAPTSSQWGDTAVPAIKNMDINGLIRRGKRYLGVPYSFGAPSYPESGKFDCATFTQYLYGKHHVSLKRTARAQAAQGTAVGRKQLRKGDLLFFYVPDRFRSNKTIGHVGIYMGNQKMLHASPIPKNSVQITNINNAYWKQTFLTARRAAY